MSTATAATTMATTNNSGNGYINSSEDFEKWIRMATDNKINTANSWDLALIDYFYDLSLLREGDGINFQKASATLDGCVKIYSSRVDSAVTETGRLINGLATSKRNQIEEEGGEDDEDDDELDPNAPVKERRSRANIPHKNTLVDFSVIKFKKVDLELYVDPLFKKALTDFDEGGSKSLLLNMLNVDESGRIMFDTTDSATSQAIKDEDTIKDIPEEQDPQKHTQQDNILDELKESDGDDESEDEQDTSMMDIDKSFAEMDIDQVDDDDQTLKVDTQTVEINVQQLGQRFLANFDTLTSSVCPSILELEGVINQKVSSTQLLEGLENAPLIDDSDSDDDGDINDYVDFDFGGGNDNFDPGSFHDNTSKYPGNKTSIFFDDLDDEADDYGITMRELFNESKNYTRNNIGDEDEEEGTISNIPDENLLAYFDEHQRKNWAGPEHWKIQRIKNNYKSTIGQKIPTDENEEGAEGSNQNPQGSKKRKQKEKMVIDFLSDDFPDEDDLFEKGGTATLLPKKDWIDKSKHVLPDDRHFTTRNFINLFLKERLINSTFNKVKNMDTAIDESLYAEHNVSLGLNHQSENVNNADFFNDDNGGGHFDFEFDDDGEGSSEPVSGQSQEVPGSQLLAKSQGKQSPLSYSRVAKKVDIRLLKDNLWDSLNRERTSRKSIVLPELTESSDSSTSSSEADDSLKFTDIVHGLNDKYDQTSKKDLSTSFCFIVLLHLANENGFTIANTDDNSDLVINNFAV